MTVFEAIEKSVITSFYTVEVPVAKSETILYRSIEAALKRIGGKYNTKTKNFAFAGTETIEQLKGLLDNLKSSLRQEEQANTHLESTERPIGHHENIPTPRYVANKMAEALGYGKISKDLEGDGMPWILEPCAGTGVIIKALLGFYGGGEEKNGGARIAYSDIEEKARQVYLETLESSQPNNMMYTEIPNVYDYKTPEMGGVPGQGAISARQYIICHPPHSKAVQMTYHLFKLLKEGGRMVILVANHFDFSEEWKGFNVWLESEPEYFKRTLVKSAEGDTEYSILTIDK